MSQRLISITPYQGRIPAREGRVDRKWLVKNRHLVSVERISYRSTGGVTVTGYVVRPKGNRKRLPCIIFNRGGYKDFSAVAPWLIYGWLAEMAQWGFVVIATQYRGTDGGEGHDENGGADLGDVLVLKDVLKELPGTDASRIGMIGFSRGGMMTYLALARVRWVKAAAIIGGVTDWKRAIGLRPELLAVAREAFGGSGKEMRARSAIHWADRLAKKTPVLILHGANDWRVSPLDALDMSRAMLKHQKPHRLIMYEGAGHALEEVEAEALEAIRAWLGKFV